MAAPATHPGALRARIRSCRFARLIPVSPQRRGEGAMARRCIVLDVHRDFAQVAIWEDGTVRDGGRVGATPQELAAFAETLGPDDAVALEATMNTAAIAALMAKRAGRVVVSNPFKTRVIAEARVKTDKVDARVLAELLAVDYLPTVWLADEATKVLRRQVARRAQLVRQ